MKRHIERAAHIAKAQSRLGSINRFVASCEIDKVTSAEIAFAIFIVQHNLPMAVWRRVWVASEEDVVYNSTRCAPWRWKKILTTAFHAFSSGLSRFFFR